MLQHDTYNIVRHDYINTLIVGNTFLYITGIAYLRRRYKDQDINGVVMSCKQANTGNHQHLVIDGIPFNLHLFLYLHLLLSLPCYPIIQGVKEIPFYSYVW